MLDSESESVEGLCTTIPARSRPLTQGRLGMPKLYALFCELVFVLYGHEDDMVRRTGPSSLPG